MAIYFLDVKPIGGNSCRSALGAAAYRTGEKLYNQNDGITHDYTRRRGAIGAAAYRSGERLNDGNTAYDFTQKGGVVYSEIMLPKHAPEMYRVRVTLWNSAQKIERNCNARTGREIVVALPNELTTEQQIKLIQDYVQRNFVDEGMCADFSIHSGHIHEKKGEIYPFQDLTVRKDNPHAHIQLTVRPINPDGTWGEKSKRENILDKNGNRIKLESGNWKSRKIELTDWDKIETLLKWRKDWAVTVNKEFERLGIDERISHLSLKEQGINREPTKHMGHEAWNLEKKGIKTEIGNENRAIMARNKALEQLEQKTPKHESSTREKLISIPNKQDINHESTAHITPENTAEFIHDKPRISDRLELIRKETQALVERIRVENENTHISEQTLSMKKENEAYRQQIREDAGKIRSITQYRIDVQEIERNINAFILEDANTSFFKINHRRKIKEQISLLEEKKKRVESSFEKKYFRSFEEVAILQNELRAGLQNARELILTNNKQSRKLRAQKNDNDKKLQEIDSDMLKGKIYLEEEIETMILQGNVEFKTIKRQRKRLEQNRKDLIETRKKINDLREKRYSLDDRDAQREIDWQIQSLVESKIQVMAKIEREIEQMDKLFLKENKEKKEKEVIDFDLEPVSSNTIVREIVREITHTR